MCQGDDLRGDRFVYRTHTYCARARTRALPANAQVIAAADGPMLASTTFRKVIDGVRGKLPAISAA